MKTSVCVLLGLSFGLLTIGVVFIAAGPTMPTRLSGPPLTPEQARANKILAEMEKEAGLPPINSKNNDGKLLGFVIVLGSGTALGVILFPQIFRFLGRHARRGVRALFQLVLFLPRRNRRQWRLIVLWITVGLIALMCLFPPLTYRFGGGRYSRHTRVVDISRLIVQCLPVLLLAGALLFTLKDKKPEP